MNRRAFLASSFGMGVTALLAQISLPPRSRTKNPYHTETYGYRGYEISFSILKSGTEIRYLAIRLMPISAELTYPQNVLAILMDAGLVEPNAGDFKPVEFTGSGAIFHILSLGKEKSTKIRGGFIYCMGNWLNAPPLTPVDLLSIIEPMGILISLGGPNPSSPPLPATLLD